MEVLPLILFAPVLLAAAVSDVRAMRIPNRLILLGLVLFAACAVALPLDSVMWRLAAAGTVFVLGFAAFALRMLGAGDVKLLAVLMLFVPPAGWPVFGIVFSAAMLLGLTFILALRAAPFATGSRLVSMRARGMFPMGVSIALSGWMLPFALTLV